jgi:hypothetical protein
MITMLTIVVAAFLIWVVVGGIVAMVVCPLMKDPAERRRKERKTADAASSVQRSTT